MPVGRFERASQIRKTNKTVKSRTPRSLRLESLEERTVLTAFLQVIHNSPYESAEQVDVYVNDSQALDNFEFRDATNFLSLPSATELTIDVKGPDSTPASDSVFSLTTTLEAGKNYIAIAVGEPGVDFDLIVTDEGQQAAVNTSNVELLVAHGSPDAPTVDVVARDVGTLVEDISFPELDDGYLSVAPATYALQITPFDDNDTIVATFEADLNGLAGGAAVVAASGFLSPGEDQPAFGLLAVFPNGDTALLPVLLTGTDGNDVFRVVPGDDGDELTVYQSGAGRISVASSATSEVAIEALDGRDYVNVSIPEEAGDLPALSIRGGGGSNRIVLVGTGEDDEFFLSQDGDSVVAVGNGFSTKVTTADRLYAFGRGGDDLIDASAVTAQDLILVGDRGDDTIVGGKRNDRIYAGGGNDAVAGLAGNDVIYGGKGNDLLLGGSGRDVLVGGLGRDLLLGGTGNDRLYAIPFWDFSAGGPGRDTEWLGRRVDRYFYDGSTFTPEDGFDELMRRFGVDYDEERIAPWLFVDP